MVMGRIYNNRVIECCIAEVKKMKLAEALSVRSDLQKRISQLSTRLEASAKVQEGDKPSEDPNVLIVELSNCFSELEKLVCRINYTNCITASDGRSLTDMIAKRDALSYKTTLLRSFLKAASEKVDRYSSKEIKIVSTVNVSNMHKVIDSSAKELRELDIKIQGINWTTELA